MRCDGEYYQRSLRESVGSLSLFFGEYMKRKFVASLAALSLLLLPHCGKYEDIFGIWQGEHGMLILRSDGELIYRGERGSYRALRDELRVAYADGHVESHVYLLSFDGKSMNLDGERYVFLARDPLELRVRELDTHYRAMKT